MANKRKSVKKTNTRVQNTRAATSRKAPAKTARTKKRSAEIKGIVLIALGIFMALSFFGGATGAVGSAFKNVLMGLFGGAAVIFFVFIIWTGINMFIEKRKENSSYKIWILLALMLVTSVLWAIWHKDTAWVYPDLWSGLKSMYAWGSDGGSGVIGTLTAIGLVKCIGTMGTTVVSIAAALILLIILTEVSLEKLFAKISGYIKRNKEQKKLHKIEPNNEM